MIIHKHLLKFGALLCLSILIACSHKDTREVVLAGYAEGDVSVYYLKIYPDSTYLLSHHDVMLNGNWTIKKDTLSLCYDNELCANIISAEKAIVYCPKFKPLSIMKFRNINPPSVVKFPN